jgi:hypothetical protein
MQTSPDSIWSLHVVLPQARLIQVKVFFKLELQLNFKFGSSQVVKVNYTSVIRILWPEYSSRIECSEPPRSTVLT